jgi:hypothetical protein
MPYLGHLAKLGDDLSVAVDDFLLEVKAQLPPGLGRVLHTATVQLGQGHAEVRVGI